MTYKILYDYGTSGLSLDDKQFETIDAAIKAAVAERYGVSFRIISIHWDPET